MYLTSSRELFAGNAGRGAGHRSPPIESAGERRIVLTFERERGRDAVHGPHRARPDRGLVDRVRGTRPYAGYPNDAVPTVHVASSNAAGLIARTRTVRDGAASRSNGVGTS